jgi:hypothetical protein
LCKKASEKVMKETYFGSKTITNFQQLPILDPFLIYTTDLMHAWMEGIFQNIFLAHFKA